MLKDWFKKTDYKDRIFRHRLQVVYRSLLIVALILVAIVFAKLHIDNRTYTNYEVVERIDRVGTVDSSFLDYEGNILVHSKNGIAVYRTDGSQMWNQSYEMQEPVVKMNGLYVAVGDYKGTTLYIMGEKGTLAQVETNLPILALDISSQGVAAALLQDEDVTWLKLFSKEGELISEIKTSMRNNGYPVAFAISPDNIKLGVSYLKAESGKINTSLAFYNFGGVGQNEMDNLVSGYEYEEQIFPMIAYPSEDVAIAAGDQRLLLMKGKQKPALHKEIELKEEMQGIYYGETAFAVTYRDMDGQGKYKLHVYDMDGKEEVSYGIDFEYKDILLKNNSVIVYNEAQILVLGLNGVVKYEGNLGGTIQALIPTDSQSKVLAVFPEEIKLIKFR